MMAWGEILFKKREKAKKQKSTKRKKINHSDQKSHQDFLFCQKYWESECVVLDLNAKQSLQRKE